MKKKMWFVLCIMTSVLLTTACGEKKEPGNGHESRQYVILGVRCTQTGI